MTRWQWDPDRYLADMHAEIADYPGLQERAVAATEGAETRDVLELGIGTGETTRRFLDLHPEARLTAIDSSPEMLERARERFPDADLRLSRLEDPLPQGPFDLVVSVLAVHHLDAAGKRDLFRRVAEGLRPGGRFLLADLVVPESEDDVVTPIDGVMDLPDRLDDQLTWLGDAGFSAEALWSFKDLAVIRARRRPLRG
jgi:tRNA (cmo5U34)-methyltransferase